MSAVPNGNLERFPELHPALDEQSALTEANRCLFCYDAPCTHACPTHIDIPRFIKKIASENMLGSAQTILESNLLGATCARVCPAGFHSRNIFLVHRYLFIHWMRIGFVDGR